MKYLAKTTLPTVYGTFEMFAFESKFDSFPHIVLSAPITDDRIPLVRIHSECMTGDTFSSERCDCGDQLDTSMEKIATQGGLLVYLRQEGRGIGLVNKMHAYNLQDQGHDTYSANIELGFHQDARDFGVAAKILQSMECNNIRLLTNNPNKMEQLEEYGIKIAERVEIEIQPSDRNLDYLRSKKEQFGHLLKKV